MSGKKEANYLLIIAGVVFIIASIEGFFYYSDYQDYLMIRIMLTLHNGLKMFVFNPSIAMKDVIDKIGTDAGVTDWVLLYTYCASVLIAQLCTMGAICIAIHKYIKIWLLEIQSRFSKKEKLLIFGYNDDVKLLIDNDYEKCKIIYLITDYEFTSREEVKLLEKRVRICNFSFRNDNNIKKSKKIFASVSRIILMSETATDNMTFYYGMNKALDTAKSVQCYLRCDQDTIRNMIEDQDNNRKENNNYESGNINLSFFNIAELRVKELFLNTAYKKIDAANNVHMLILGLGDTGKELLKQSILLGAVSCDNNILIDVVDQNVAKEADYFIGRFDQSAFRKSLVTIGNSSAMVYEILPGHCDGKLIIRFMNFNIKGECFKDVLHDLEKESQITYSAVCVKNPDVTLQAMMILHAYFRDTHASDTPIAIRLTTEENLLEYSVGNQKKDDEGTYKNVYVMKDNSSLMKLEQICSSEIENHAIEHNYCYSQIQDGNDEYILDFKRETAELAAAKKQWSQLPVWKRQSNRNASYYFQYHNNNYTFVDAIQFEKEKNEIRNLLRLTGDKQGEMVLEWMSSKSDNEMHHEIIECAKTEHRRWNYAMALDGWRYDRAKNVAKKKHDCITKWDKLMVEKKDALIYDFIPALIYLKRE